jgi:predicted DNA-binding protein with PD1-like motif
MKSKSVSDGVERTFIVILDQGEEAFKFITDFANKEKNHRRLGIGDRRVFAGQGRLVRSCSQEIQAD